MKVFVSECTPHYGSYTFPYAIYCVAESQDELTAVYNGGFLPYTGNWQQGTAFAHNVFYLARSLRVDLQQFRLSSENRRVLRRAGDDVVCGEPLALASAEGAALVGSQSFSDFCCAYADKHFVGNSMSAERLRFVLSRSAATHLFRFGRRASNDAAPLAYVLAMIRPGECLHYWFAWLDDTAMQSMHIGNVAMLRVLQWAQNEGLKHVYLGTVYHEKALYKVRPFSGVQWFAGSHWSSDVAELKRRCALDGAPLASGDYFKENEARQSDFIAAQLANAASNSPISSAPPPLAPQVMLNQLMTNTV
jgi:hypothetical protein